LKQAGTAVGGDDAALLVKAIGGNMAEMMKAQQEMMFSGSSPAKSKAEEELAGILWLEHDLKSQLYDMQEAAYEAKIASDQLLVANETSAGVANMLGEMRREMHEFGAPFYRKVLQEKIDEIVTQKKALLAQIEAEKGREARKKAEAVTPVKPTAPAKRDGAGPWVAFAIVVSCFVVIALVFFMIRKRSQTANNLH